ncbi:MAG: glycosyltransferase family 39 protein [Chloroflexi bacterium]|nr:glycosyltransferase family 39 protein [Chloroflexota bacterium]
MLWREHCGLLAILALFALLCGVYSAIVPLGEPPDELAHYQYVRYLDATGHPPLTAQDRSESGYKGHEPPLYYMVTHRLTRFLRVAQRPMLPLIDPDVSPRHSIGDEVMLWNSVLHTEDERFPWHGTSLAWHTLRLLSIPLGMITILCTYGIARTLFPQRRTLALAAAGINAFIPQFVYISSVMNNDNLAVPLSTGALWILVYMARRGDLRWRWFVLLGVLVGLARICKFYTLLLLPIIAVALLLIAWQHKRWGRVLLGGLLVLALTLAVASPWIIAVQPDNPDIAPKGVVGFIAKLLDIVHTDRMLRSKGMSAAGGGLAAFPAMVLSFFQLEPKRWATLLFQSFWAYYGPMTVAASPALYRALLGVVVLAGTGLLGLAARSLRRRAVRVATPGLGGVETLTATPPDGGNAAQPLSSQSAPQKGGALAVGVGILALQAVAFLLLEALFYTIMRRLPDTAQGRHMYSAMPAWALGLAAGLLAWIPARRERALAPIVAPILISALLILSVVALPAWVMPAYQPLLPFRTTLIRAWQPEAPVDAEAAPGIRYLGPRSAQIAARAGETAELTLLWQAIAPIETEYLLRVDLVDGEGRAHLLHLSHPLGGRWPTRAWDEGVYLSDQHTLALPTLLPAGEYSLRVTWVMDDLQPVGPSLDAGTLQVSASSASTGSLQVDIEGGQDSAVGYRGALTVTAPGAQTARFVADDGSAWEPIATETYEIGTAALERAFFIVTGQTQPREYRLVLNEGLSAWATRPITVTSRERQFTAPADLTPVNANFGDQVTLLGYRLEGVGWSESPREGLTAPYATLQPGQTVDVLLAWQARRWVPRNYTVFVHLLDESGAVRAQHDQVPRFDYSTLFWVPGEIVIDWYHLSLPEDAPPGNYQIQLGMYERVNNTRLSIQGTNGASDTRVLLPSLLVLDQ